MAKIIAPPTDFTTAPKATKSEKLRCGVGFQPGGQEKPAVSKDFVQLAQSYGELHKYCEDQYGPSFVAYVSAPGLVIKEAKNMQAAYPYEIGSRAICCKELPNGMDRVTFFRNARIANAEASKLHIEEAMDLERRLLRLTDTFSLCTKGAGCYAVTDVEARTLSNSFRMLENVTLNHIAHINRCLMKDVYDPLSNCMNLTQLKAYLNQNKNIIDHLFDLMEKILLRIEKNDAISRRFDIKKESKPAKPATLRALNLVFDGVKSLAAFTLKHKWTLLWGAIFTIQASQLIGPSLAPIAAAFSGQGVNAGAAQAFSQLSTLVCRFVSKPVVFSLFVSSVMYYIVNSKTFTAILSATLSSAAFTAKFAAYVATLGTAAIPVQGFVKYLEDNKITWESLVKAFFQNKASTLAIYAIPQMVMSWLGFVIQGLISTWCVVADTASSVQQVLSRGVDYGTYGLQWITNKVFGATAPEQFAPGIASMVTGDTIEKLAAISESINNNSVLFGDAATGVLTLLGVTELVQRSAPIFEPFIQVFFADKNQELDEISRLRNNSTELRDYVFNETEVSRKAGDAFMQEFFGQQSSLSQYDQGRLSNNAVVNTQIVQLEALSETITPHHFLVSVNDSKRGTINARASDINVDQDTAILDVTADSLTDLQNIPRIEKAVQKAEESKEQTKKALADARLELIDATEKADTEEEKKIYDKEVEHLIQLSDSLNTPIPGPKIIPTLIDPKAVKVSAVIIERPRAITLEVREKAVQKEAIIKKAPQFTPPREERNENTANGKAITLVALSKADVTAAQAETGAKMLILDEKRAIVKAIVDNKTGDFVEVTGDMPAPTGPMRLPTIAASKNMLDSIRGGVVLNKAKKTEAPTKVDEKPKNVLESIKAGGFNLRKVTADQLTKSLEKVNSKALTPGDATQVDASDFLLAALTKRFASINQTQKQEETSDADFE